MIKPEGYKRLGEILDAMHRAKLSLSNLRMVRLTEAQAIEFVGDNQLTPRAQSFLAGPVTAVEVVGENAPSKIRHILHQIETKSSNNGGQLFAASTQTRTHQQEIDFFFKNRSLGSTAFFRDCSVCVVKPHAVVNGNTGYVLSRLSNAGFEISALQLFSLDKSASAEFLEVYQGVLPEYNALVNEMQSGPCVAIEVRLAENVVPSLREICGPADPTIAKVIRPNTIRADIGASKVQNGVHCTDLEEDGTLESEFFFSILQRQ